MADPNKSWALTEESFHGLLDFLDSTALRLPFNMRGFARSSPDYSSGGDVFRGAEYADETIDRVARKIEAGIETRPDNPYLYIHGVALNLIRERWRKAGHDAQSLETLPPTKSPFVDPAKEQERRATEQENERRLLCLHDCLDALPPASREILTAYHLGGPGVHIGRRKSLANVLNLPAGALRLRAYRIRRQMERCLGQCLSRQRPIAEETLF